MKTVYIIGSLKNWKVIKLSNRLRKQFPELEIFDSWISPGPEADDYWKKYSKMKGLTYREALKDWSATHIFEFDKFHIDRSDVVVMHMPCGKSGHLELGYAIGRGKKGYVFFDEEPDEGETIYKLPRKVLTNLKDLEKELGLHFKKGVEGTVPERDVTSSDSEKKKVCLIGNITDKGSIKKTSKTAERIRSLGFEVVEEWHQSGPENFDPGHLEKCDRTILYQPSGKVGHLELGYAVGRGKKGYILFDEEPETRWDIMYQFATEVCMNFGDLEKELKKD